MSNLAFIFISNNNVAIDFIPRVEQITNPTKDIQFHCRRKKKKKKKNAGRNFDFGSISFIFIRLDNTTRIEGITGYSEEERDTCKNAQVVSAQPLITSAIFILPANKSCDKACHAKGELFYLTPVTRKHEHTPIRSCSFPSISFETS